MSLQLQTVRDPAQLAEEAVGIIEDYGAQCLLENGHFLLSLAGGSTPKAVYRLWGERSVLTWDKLHLIYGDERCVPPDHPDSNAGMAAEALLDRLPTPPTTYRMEGENPNPEHAASDYENTLRGLLQRLGAIDLALLGIGGDGHTASLFPGATAVHEEERLCVSTPAPDGKTMRLTLTAPALKGARRIMFMAAGRDKAEVIRQVVEGEVIPGKFPSQLFLRDEALQVTLLLDEAAATELSGQF
ncbi:MAG: 6-phosphogluconolactonase [SAR324 cluster bacterium]|nr:6-phosphogluconolactonase [SAR324 cluster bacterium]